MPTTDECLCKAEHYERQADLTDSDEARDIFLLVAASWRRKGAIPVLPSAETSVDQAELARDSNSHPTP